MSLLKIQELKKESKIAKVESWHYLSFFHEF